MLSTAQCLRIWCFVWSPRDSHIPCDSLELFHSPVLGHMVFFDVQPDLRLFLYSVQAGVSVIACRLKALKSQHNHQGVCYLVFTVKSAVK